MYDFLLESLNLKASDLEHLSEKERIKRIRLQWMNLCFNAKTKKEVQTYTRNCHRLVSPLVKPHPIHAYFEQQSFDIPHSSFDLLQREAIEKTYEDLLEEFSHLSTETEKQDFAKRYADFLNLAESLIKNQNKFDDFLGEYFYLKKKETLRGHIIYQWRLQMIRLFASEDLDDNQYRQALASGDLGPILSRHKLLSPIKIAVALVNSLFLVLTATLQYILKLHFLLELGFFFLFKHPLVIFMVQLPFIASILEKIACPMNQIIRPLSAYTHCSVQKIAFLVSMASLTALYAVLYTSVLAQMVVLLPYISWAFFGYFLYLMAKQCIAVFKISFAAGCGFTVTIAVLFGLRALLGKPDSGQSHTEATIFEQCLSILGVFSMLTMLTAGQNKEDGVEHLPLVLPGEPIPQTIYDIAKIGCNTKHLSHRFFKTPKTTTSSHSDDKEKAIVLNASTIHPEHQIQHKALDI